MKFQLRLAVPEDVPEILAVMNEAYEAMENKADYITDEEGYIARHIKDEGFILVGEAEGVMAGFFMVSTPKPEENDLGQFLALSEEQLRKTALMDSAAVRPQFQGQGLMGEMFREAVKRAEVQYPCLLGTVAPGNLPSRRNFEKMGFVVEKTVVKHGGYARLLMGKRKALDFSDGIS